jgi:twitching motility protein PilT
MEQVIKAAVKRGASDIHIKAGDVFRARINGELEPLTKQRLTPEQTKELAAQLITNKTVREQLDDLYDYTCSWGAPGVGRFRVSLLRQRSSFMIVMRVMPFEIPSLQRLNLPTVCEEIALANSGLILVTGPPTSGKSTTIAAMISHANATAKRHIVTIEKPIEYLHRDMKSSVTQREVGIDTMTWNDAFAGAIRQDADIIVAHWIADRDMADQVLAATETGRVVIASVPAFDSLDALNAFVSLYPLEERPRARRRLVGVLNAVTAQRLLPSADGEGRAVAVEVLRGTEQIRELLREEADHDAIHDALDNLRSEHGTQSLEQHLIELVDDEKVTAEVALAAANHPDRMAAASVDRRRGSDRRTGADRRDTSEKPAPKRRKRSKAKKAKAKAPSDADSKSNDDGAAS